MWQESIEGGAPVPYARFFLKESFDCKKKKKERKRKRKGIKTGRKEGEGRE